MSHITLLIFTFVLNEEFRFLLKKVSLYEYSMSRIKIYGSNQNKNNAEIETIIYGKRFIARFNVKLTEIIRNDLLHDRKIFKRVLNILLSTQMVVKISYASYF